MVPAFFPHVILWYTLASLLIYPYVNESDTPVFSHWADWQAILEEGWRNAILRKQMHYSSCKTFIKWVIVSRKYLKMPFFLCY